MYSSSHQGHSDMYAGAEIDSSSQFQSAFLADVLFEAQPTHGIRRCNSFYLQGTLRLGLCGGAEWNMNSDTVQCETTP